MADINPEIFKAYDIRGVYPKDINEEVIYKITQAYIKVFKPKKVVLGRDVRESGEKLFQASMKGFVDAGVDVVDIGMVATDQYTFAVGHLGLDGGLTISASHNPREWNGMNISTRNAEPVSSQSGLFDIRDLLQKDMTDIVAEKKGNVEKKDITEDYLKMVSSFVNLKNITKKKVVANANFGVNYVLLQKAISMFDLPLEIVPLNEKPDGTFPKGPPNPLLPENRSEFLNLIKQSHADFGVAWDADGDRCFFADETGTFIEGYFMTALFAKDMLEKYPGSKILIDPRLVWATKEEIVRSGGIPVVSRAGNTIISGRMKQEDILFGGEMSSHFYFRGSYYRDNGMIPFFLILEMLSLTNTPLSQLVAPYMTKYLITGEINFETHNKDQIIEAAKETYKDGKQEFIDGLSVEYADWRFNIRKSNTEPLLRLNVEARSRAVLDQKHAELDEFIKNRA